MSQITGADQSGPCEWVSAGVLRLAFLQGIELQASVDVLSLPPRSRLAVSDLLASENL